MNSTINIHFVLLKRCISYKIFTSGLPCILHVVSSFSSGLPCILHVVSSFSSGLPCILHVVSSFSSGLPCILHVASSFSSYSLVQDKGNRELVFMNCLLLRDVTNASNGLQFTKRLDIKFSGKNTPPIMNITIKKSFLNTLLRFTRPVGTETFQLR